MSLPYPHAPAEHSAYTRLDHVEWTTIDQIRGDSSRSACIRMLVREALNARMEKEA